MRFILTLCVSFLLTAAKSQTEPQVSVILETTISDRDSIRFAHVRETKKDSTPEYYYLITLKDMRYPIKKRGEVNELVSAKLTYSDLDKISEGICMLSKRKYKAGHKPISVGELTMAKESINGVPTIRFSLSNGAYCSYATMENSCKSANEIRGYIDDSKVAPF